MDEYDNNKTKEYYYDKYVEMFKKNIEIEEKYNQANDKIIKKQIYQKEKSYEFFLKKKDEYIICDICNMEIKLHSFNGHKKTERHKKAIILKETLKKLEEEKKNNQKN